MSLLQNDYILLGHQKYVPEEDLYRVNHDATGWRSGLPEVFPFYPNHFTEFSKDWQILSRQLNPQLTNEQWRAVYTYQRAFTNQQGFGMTPPRADWVNMRNLDAENPRQEALVCGGAILKRRFLDDEYLYPVYLDGNRPAPPLDWLLKRPYLFFDAVTVVKTINGIVIRRFPQGEGDRVFILLLASRPIKIHLSKVTRLRRWTPLPSPYQYP